MKQSISLIAAASLLAIAAPAAAQDDANTSAFTGFRIEGLAGYDMNKPRPDASIDNAAAVNDSINGATYGAGAGYDFAIGGATLGVEGEWMWTNADRDYTTTGFTNYGVSSVDPGRDLYIGARVGVPVSDMVLLYAKGGYTNQRYRVTTTDNLTSATTRLGLDGWRIGAGAQFALGKNVYVKAEYRYSKYSDGTVDAPTGATPATFDLGASRNQIIGGVGFKF
jgi:outer membrane immunogenic protein